MGLMIVGARSKYGVRGALRYKNPSRPTGGDNPQNNPKVTRRARLGMTPRRNWGQGDLSKRAKGG